MIIEKESEIKVLKNFYNYPFDYFSISEIREKIGMSRNWIYKIINKFEKFTILQKLGKKYKLDFTNLFCKRTKLLFDAEYLNSYDKEIRNKIFNITDKIKYEINPESIILVGSVALNKQKENSDIDFLVITSKREIPYFENCNIILLTQDMFKEKYLKGDDMIISALLFGKVVFDKNFFLKFFESPLPIFSQEVIQEKIKYCEKLKERIFTLLKIDEKQSKEELLYFVLQVARIILLKREIVPKTKHDLVQQIKPLNKELSVMITRVLNRNVDKKKMLDYVERGLKLIT